PFSARSTPAATELPNPNRLSQRLRVFASPRQETLLAPKKSGRSPYASLAGRVDVRGQTFQAVDGFLHGRPNHTQRVQHFLGSGVVPLGFQREQIVCQVPNRALDLAEIHRESAVRIGE